MAWDNDVLILLVLLQVGIGGSTVLTDGEQNDTMVNETQTLQNVKRQTTSPPALNLDFENPTDRNYFTITPNTPPGYVLSKSSIRFKSGSSSLHWKWPASTTNTKPLLKLDFGTIARTGKEVTQGGITFWIYHKKTSPTSTMQIVFVGTDKNGVQTRSEPTDVNLNFEGWRSVWICYAEFPPGQYNLKTLSSIEFKITSTSADSLYIDLIQSDTYMYRQTRDLVVEKVGKPTPNNTPFHNEKDSWQQSLRWYKLPQQTTFPKNPKAVTDDILIIEDRLENWYASTSEALYSLKSGQTAQGYDFQDAKRKRWEDLLKNIKQAHDNNDKIKFADNRPPLFPYQSKLGKDRIETTTTGQIPITAKTSLRYVMARILLPLSIEYNFMTRQKEKEFLSTTDKNKYCKALNGARGKLFKEAVQKIAGKNRDMKRKLKALVRNEKRNNGGLVCTSTSNTLDTLIDQLNEGRFAKIKTLLEFLREQGWAKGSGLGSLAFQMLRTGTGFMHSMFLLRKKLRSDRMFSSLVETMKWYNDFNEIYQDDNDYVYDGTTADRMRTMLLFRLMVILIDNRDKDQQVHALKNYQTWVKHALRVNKGLGGFIKPDFTGFHHKTFYGSAYVIEALHNAALVQYLLDGTHFELAQEPKDNIRKGLETMRTVSVKYSTPNSIGGRFPGYTNKKLVNHIAAYAYSCYDNARGTTAAVRKPEMFLRLFDTSVPEMQSYFEQGNTGSGLMYLNTIGSLDVLKQASTLTCSSSPPCTAESSPTGHWYKSFAALSIHRRGDWSVAAKGMNRYTWDYESSATENVFGVFASHGSLQISNSEDALKVYDVENGWDWTRVPGTTTIKMDTNQVKTSLSRNYNYKGKFAGGVAFIGSTGGKPQHGAFGMHFKNPKYKMETKDNLQGTPLAVATFQFKKSYFFYDHLIVCLGSDIQLSNVNTANNFAQTTLFQDKLSTAFTSIEVREKGKTTLTLAGKNYKKSWVSYNDQRFVRIKDTNGNTYKVHYKKGSIDAPSLEVIDKQESKKADGKTISDSPYAVAYIKHNRGNNKGGYMYGVLISGGDEKLLKSYSVIKQSSLVHAIKLSNIPGKSSDIYGYTVFENVPGSHLSEGPVKRVSGSCVIMAEKDGQKLHLAISDPNINFGNNPDMHMSSKPNRKKTCTVCDRRHDKVLYPTNSNYMGSKLLFCVKGKKTTPAIKVVLSHNVQRIDSVLVNGKSSNLQKAGIVLDTSVTGESTLTFKKLRNGFSTEVTLTLA